MVNTTEANIRSVYVMLVNPLHRIYKWRTTAKSISVPKTEKPIAQDSIEIKRLRK